MATLNDLLLEYGDLIITDAKSNLVRLGKNNTSSLYKSLKAVVNNDELSFDMTDYGKYVDQGRSGDNYLAVGGKQPGKYVPVNELEKWMKQRNIDLKYSFVINRAIKVNGIKATNFFTDAYDKYEPELDVMLDDYLDGFLDDELGDI